MTSPTGAALRDILAVLRRRFPIAKVLIYPVPVQGQGAAEKIAKALDRASARAECDVIVLARGGGSVEDLWSFNEEAVARAIHRCAIPLVTGVGHEIDFTIADFAADQRAATPSAAAELITPDASEWRGWLDEINNRLGRRMREALTRAGDRLLHVHRRLHHPRRRIFDGAQKLDGLSARLSRASTANLLSRQSRLATVRAKLAGHDPASVVRARLDALQALDRRLSRAALTLVKNRRSHVTLLERTLEATGPKQTLERGYAIVLRESDGGIVRDAAALVAGERIEARLASGSVKAIVD